MTTPAPSLPNTGPDIEPPEPTLTAPVREVAGLALTVAGATGALITLGFLVSPLAVLLAVFVLLTVAGVRLSTSEV